MRLPSGGVVLRDNAADVEELARAMYEAMWEGKWEEIVGRVGERVWLERARKVIEAMSS